MIKRNTNIKYCGIYKITNPNGKEYVGKSKDIEYRFMQYAILDKRVIGIKLYNSLCKYSWDYHIFEIIEECSEDQLNEREIHWIKQCNSVKDGLNIKHGGEGGNWSDESKLKASINRKGKPSPMKGKSRSYKGRISPNKGKKRTNESKILISTKLKGKSQNGKHVVNCITNQKWISASEAGRYYNVSSVTIHNWVKNNKNNLKYN
jgi:group I intron endonuclease